VGGIRRTRSINDILTRYLVALSLASMAVVSVVQIAFNYRNRTIALSERLGFEARSAAAAIDGYVRGKAEDLDAAAWFARLGEAPEDEARLALQSMLGYDASIRRITFVDGNGDLVAEATRRSSFAERERRGDALAAAAAAGRDRPRLGPVRFDPDSDEPLVDLCVPVSSRVPGERGILVAELNLIFMGELLGSVRTGESAYVVDRGGALIAHADPTFVVGKRAVGGFPAASAFSRGDPGGAGRLETYADADGRRVVGAFIPLEEAEWAVIAELRWLDAYARTLYEAAIGVLLYLVLAVAVTIAGLRISRILSSPVVTLERAASAIAAGGEVTLVEAPGTTETAALAEAFNAMTSRLSEKERRFALLLQNSSDLIEIVSADGAQEWVSPNVSRVLGWTADELVGRSVFDFVHPEDGAEARTALAGLLGRPGTPHRAEFRILHREGRWVDVETIGVNLLDVQGIGGIVLNSRDASERKAAEAERARLQERLPQATKMEAVGRLAGGIAHDFNNLLTCVMGNVELALLESSDADSLKSYLGEVKRASESAASLTRQLLAFSRKQAFEPRDVDVNALVEGLRGMLGRLLGEDIVVRLRLAEGLPLAKADPGQMQQVLVNLAANARDAMPRGGTLVIATALAELGASNPALRPGMWPGKMVMLSVIDDGEGMDAETKRHLFEPFYTTKAVGEGTGLGLAPVYGIVTQAGGAVDAYSERGFGTRFDVYLPLAERSPAAAPREEDEERLPRGSETVLLVEDQEGVLRMAGRMLAQLGYAVIPASSGEEAVRFMESRSEEVDLLLSDVVMPGMNGKELADRVAAMKPGIRIVLCSGYAENVVLKDEGGGIAYPFLAKPYSIRELAGKLRETLDASPSRN